MAAKHIIPGFDDPTCGIAVAAKQLVARGVGEDGEVWVHSMWTPMVIKASVKALLTGKKLVRMPHGCTEPGKLKYHWNKKRWVAPIERWLFRHAERIVATCEDEVDWIKAFEPKVKRVEIVRLAHKSDEMDSFSAPIVCSGYEQTSKAKLLYVGRLHPLKGVEYLLQAIPTECKLVIIGKDEGEGKKLRGIAQRRGIDVDFKGIVSEAEKEAAYQWCDVFILPTLSENFGLVVAEALERGKRVITTDGAPAWGPEECGNMEMLPVSNSNNQSESQIWKGYGGRLTYLRGYRDGTDAERVAMLKSAIEDLICTR